MCGERGVVGVGACKYILIFVVSQLLIVGRAVLVVRTGARNDPRIAQLVLTKRTAKEETW